MSTICERPLDETQYHQALQELNQKINFIKRPEASNSRAALDVGATIERYIYIYRVIRVIRVILGLLGLYGLLSAKVRVILGLL